LLTAFVLGLPSPDPIDDRGEDPAGALAHDDHGGTPGASGEVAPPAG
jgi:hypothetical protein